MSWRLCYCYWICNSRRMKFSRQYEPMGSHKYIVFWLTKTLWDLKCINYVSMCLFRFFVPFIQRPVHFFHWEFPLSFPIFMLSILRYFPFPHSLFHVTTHFFLLLWMYIFLFFPVCECIIKFLNFPPSIPLTTLWWHLSKTL